MMATTEPAYVTDWNLRNDPGLYYRRAVDNALGYTSGNVYAIHATTVEGRCVPAIRNVRPGYVTLQVNAMLASGRYRRVHVSLDLCG